MAISFSFSLTAGQELGATLGGDRVGLTPTQFAQKTLTRALDDMMATEKDNEQQRIRNQFKNATESQRQQIRDILLGVPTNRPD